MSAGGVADITIDDLLHWQRELTYRPAKGISREEGLSRVISWAAAIRVTPPVVPALRGGEIVVAPPRTLERIEQAEGLDRAGFLRMLADQPIAALLVDRTFADEAPADSPVSLLVAGGSFQGDTESVLNRLFTERRADLYGIGSELSRALSSSTMAGASLDALLEAASLVTSRPILLLNAEGGVIAASTGSLDHPSFLPIGSMRLMRDSTPTIRRVDAGERSWLVLPLRPGGRGSGARDTNLAVGIDQTASTEVERLTLTQTGAAIDIMLGHAGLPIRERWNREGLVADLLLGRLSSREAADARARLLGLDPAQPARVALFIAEDDGAFSRLRSSLPEERGRAAAALSPSEYALILTGEQAASSPSREVAAAFRALSTYDTSARLTISEPVDGASSTPAALDQARMLGRLVEHGALAGPVIQADQHDQLGLFGLLMPFVAEHDLDRGHARRRLADYASSWLGPLEEHDAQRGSELIVTLSAYLQLGGALAQAADRLGIHRNTLTYRLGRIEELTGRDLNDPATRFLLHVALTVRKLEQAASG